MADNGEHVNIDRQPPADYRGQNRRDNKTLILVVAIIAMIMVIIGTFILRSKGTNPISQLQQTSDISKTLKELQEGQSVLFENQKKLDEKINQPVQVNCEDVKKCLTTPPKTPTQPHPHPTPTPKPPPPPPPTATNDNKLEIVVHCSGGCSDIPPPPPPPQVENPLPPPPPQPTEQKVRKVTILTPTYYIKTDSYPDKKWRKNK